MSNTNIASEFTCKCKKQKYWLCEGVITSPCPNCGRVYIGIYSFKHLGIIGKELK